MAALPVTLRRRHIETGFIWLWGRSSSIPGSALELWTSACTTTGLGRSLGEYFELVQVNPWAELRGSCMSYDQLEAN